jgi:hypothetical protein
MNVKDVDKKLDIKMKLAILDNADIFRWSKLHDLNISIFIKNDSKDPENYYFQAFIMKDLAHPVVKDLIEAYSPIETETFYMLSHPVVNTKILSLIRELWGVPSIVFNETTIENGKLILRMLFHSLYKKDVSLILNKYITIPYFIDDMLLVESEGTIFLTEKRNKRSPLSIIQYSIPLSIQEKNSTKKILPENSKMAQIVDNPFNQNSFKIMIFSENLVEEKKGIKYISLKDNIYETDVAAKLPNLIRHKANSLGIFRNETLVKINRDRLYYTSTIASNRLMEYMQMVFSSSLELYGKNVVRLENSCDFDPELLASF